MGTREGEGINGKYLLIEVPNFNDAASEAEAMGSYLRLGAVKDPSLAANPGAPRATGEDLAARVTSFIDDTRKRDGCPDFLPEAERQAETAKLHTKGGWRDHSDGNRITTTRGDKVEVIKGNYRMLVLGRQEDTAGWDVSGGHIQDATDLWTAATTIEWVQNYNGTWKVTEKTEKGDVDTTYHGDTFDRFYGNKQTSITGSEAPTAERPNPTCLSSTWAQRIESYTGSAACPVPQILDETWADRIASKTTATAISDETTAQTISSTTSATSISDETAASTVSSTTTASLVSDTTIGEVRSVTIGNTSDVTIGNAASITVGATEEVTIGGLVELTIAAMLEVSLTAGVSINMGPKAELNLTNRQELSQFRTNVKNICASVSSAESVSTGAYNLMSGVINLF
ncbi:hypothetical protein sce8322 [Sorangium cellulosum So ce56]|uniref:Uncharacterized protein n=1 Tax=Sorangium cellulosum (strain So ce56) TaxID=448385 RepID=A9FT49_SORC5|nr:hypothetical protein [Sorangium cellulosum]CAN98492.1 hypothetical protein sce8322 [Sorangium cellulosum So ce56]